MASSSFNHINIRNSIYVNDGLQYTSNNNLLEVCQNMPSNSIFIAITSSKPTHRPTGMDWCGYVFMKGSSYGVNIMAIDSSKFATAHTSGSATSITWHII